MTLFREHFLPLLLGLKTWVNFGNLVRDRLLPRSWDRAALSAPKWEYCGFHHILGRDCKQRAITFGLSP